MLESAYQACLRLALTEAGLRFESELPVTLRYRSLEIPHAYRLDFLIEERLVVEIKSVERVLPVHRAQVMTYLRMTGAELGLLLNFAVPLMRHGIHAVYAPRVPGGPTASMEG